MSHGKCFFVTPIGETGSETRKQFQFIKSLVKRVCDHREIDLDLTCIFDVSASGNINSEVVQHLKEDYFCIINLSGINANVMYEYGIRVQTGKGFVVFAPEGTKLPFDVIAERTFFFEECSENDKAGSDKFEEGLRKAVADTLKNYKQESPLLKPIIEDVHRLLPNARHKQSITFTIRNPNIPGMEDYLIFDCKHEYMLLNINNTENIINIETFNDISIPEDVNKNLPAGNRTQFNAVEFILRGGRKITHYRNNPKYNREFFPDEYKRPHFKGNQAFSGREGDKATLIFDITNVHKLQDKHLWYFEQLSANLVLIIDNQSDYPHDKFHLIFNHPNREAIENNNKDKMGEDGKLKDDFIEINIDYPFLPYQGFELQWDLMQRIEVSDADE